MAPTRISNRLAPWLLGCASALFWVAGVVLYLSGMPMAAQEGPLREEQPKGITVEQIIKSFTQKEADFKRARELYTWRQDVRLQTMDGNTPTGEYRNVFDVVFDDKGRRTENILFAPQSTLKDLELTKEDLDDFENHMPFTVTAEELPLYDVLYVGEQKQDELNTFVFDVAPKKIERGKRYFQGRIWVDDHDLQIVKSFGKSVPDLVNGKPVTELSEKKRKSVENQNLFPKFTTWREQIDGKYWFPTYTKVDDVLHFDISDVHIKQVIKYTNYKRFESKSRIIFEGEELKSAPETAPKSPK